VNPRPVACPILVGRDRELDLLHEARRGLAKSQAACVLIGGDAGIGKSRLLAQFVRQLADGRVRNVVAVECLEYAPAPFGPIREALDRLTRMARLPLSPLLARFVARDVSSDKIEKADLFFAVAEFFRECARERATIVTIEDVHWADATTLEFLGYAASRFAGSRILVVATYRSNETERYEPLGAAIARLVREPSTFRLELDALAKADVRALIAGALEGHSPLTAETIAGVVSRAEGNPFFAEELLKDALGTSRGGQEHGRSELPLSIRASIVERLRSFAPTERTIIDRAAVLGLRFDPHVLARTMQTDVDAVLPTLRKARDANLIVEHEDAGRIVFGFRHALTRQAVYDDLLLFDARRTHRSILETLESFDAQDEYLEELAYHAWEAREAEKTLRYNERCAHAAFTLHALPQARLAYERALGAATDRRDALRLLERLVHVMSLLGDFSSAIETSTVACGTAIECADFDAAARLTRISVADRYNSGDPSALAFGMAFLERWGDRVGSGPRDELYALLARLCTILYDLELAATMLGRIADPSSLPPVGLQNVLVVRSDSAWIRGDVAAWTSATEQLLEVLPALPAGALIPSYNIAEGASYHGRDDLVARALAYADRFEARYDSGGARAFGIAVRSLDFYARGDLAGARAAIRNGRDWAHARAAAEMIARLAPFIADALDDDSLMVPEVETVFADARRAARHPDDALILAAAAFWSLRRGRASDALADIRLALGCVTRPLVHTDAVGLLAAQCLPLDELDALAALTDYAAYDATSAMLRAHTLATAAIVARRREGPDAAVPLGLAAADIYRRLGRPLCEARALESAGQINAARERYERCGAVGWAKRLVDPGAARADVPGASLSSRELDVARLIAAGLGNSAIAERLSITTKTVEKHVGSIYDKLGVRSRPQVALLLSGALDHTTTRSA
jgi:DNA-binding CsgD family transcriptional regulator